MMLQPKKVKEEEELQWMKDPQAHAALRDPSNPNEAPHELVDVVMVAMCE
jgi:hypothetical protein